MGPEKGVIEGLSTNVRNVIGRRSLRTTPMLSHTNCYWRSSVKPHHIEAQILKRVRRWSLCRSRLLVSRRSVSGGHDRSILLVPTSIASHPQVVLAPSASCLPFLPTDYGTKGHPSPISSIFFFFSSSDAPMMNRKGQGSQRFELLTMP